MHSPNGYWNIKLALERDHQAAIEGATWGPKLLEFAPSSWRRHMREKPHYRSFGTLRFLLETAREKFETEPTVALQITAAVLNFVDSVPGPSPVHVIGIRGLARKEHANALRATGDLRDALKFAKKAAVTYDTVPSLAFYASQARLVAAQVLYEMGEYDEAMRLTRRCIAIFDDFKEPSYRILARLTEGCIHMKLRQYRVALSVFRDVVVQAEIEGDKNLYARGLLNTAAAARELGDIATARELYPRVINYMSELGLSTELPRVTWSYALTLVAEGKLESAISEFYKVRNLYLHFGMNLDAATAELEIVRIRFQTGEDVTEACSQLVDAFSKAGAAQNVLEAFAYLREQSASGKMSIHKIESVRTYFSELANKPNLRFARPSEDFE